MFFSNGFGAVSANTLCFHTGLKRHRTLRCRAATIARPYAIFPDRRRMCPRGKGPGQNYLGTCRRLRNIRRARPHALMGFGAWGVTNHVVLHVLVASMAPGPITSYGLARRSIRTHRYFLLAASWRFWISDTPLSSPAPLHRRRGRGGSCPNLIP